MPLRPDVRRELRNFWIGAGIAIAAATGLSIAYLLILRRVPAGVKISTLMTAVPVALIWVTFFVPFWQLWRRHQRLVSYPDLDPNVWCKSPVTNRFLLRSDGWWRRFPYIAPAVATGIMAIVFTLIGLTSGRFTYSVWMAPCIAFIAFLAAYFPPRERARVLRIRRELHRCERCLYPLRDVRGTICPECAHDNAYLASRSTSP